MQLTDLQISARNTVAKYGGHTRGHAATLVSGLSSETCRAIVDATKLGDEKTIAAEVTAQLKAGDGERLATHKAAIKKDQEDSDPATGLVKKGGKGKKAAAAAAEPSDSQTDVEGAGAGDEGEAVDPPAPSTKPVKKKAARK